MYYQLVQYNPVTGKSAVVYKSTVKSIDIQSLCVYNDKLFFSGSDAAHGRELWQYDGTNAMLAADVNGKWTWEMEGRNGQKRVQSLTLKAEGDKLTGSVPGRNGQETAIENGSFKDGEVKFEVTRERQGNKMTTKYSGKVEGNKITGKIQSPGRDGGEGRSRDWVATKAE